MLEVNVAKNDLIQLKEDVNGLILKTDAADKYDDLNKTIYATSVQVQTNLQKFKRFKHELQEIKTRQSKTTFSTRQTQTVQ